MNNSAENGHLSFMGAILLGIVNWFTPGNIDMTLKVITAIGALISGILAARYYIYATRAKKKELKKYEEEKNNRNIQNN